MLNSLLEIEMAAATVEEAVTAALSHFGCSRAEVETTILQMPDRGLLRLLRRRPARVRLCLCDRAFIARRIAEYLLHLADIPARVSVLPGGRDIRLCVESKLAGLVIGRRGQNLDALQTLVSMLADRVTDRHTPIVITAGDPGANPYTHTRCSEPRPSSVAVDADNGLFTEKRNGNKASHRRHASGPEARRRTAKVSR